jgi:hypothetical protein
MEGLFFTPQITPPRRMGSSQIRVRAIGVVREFDFACVREYVELKSDLPRGFFLDTSTPEPRSVWLEATEHERWDWISECFSEFDCEAKGVSLAGVSHNGEVYVTLDAKLKASERSSLLLDVELQLKARIDPSIVVWCQPTQDRNALRKLRGVTVLATTE